MKLRWHILFGIIVGVGIIFLVSQDEINNVVDLKHQELDSRTLQSNSNGSFQMRDVSFEKFNNGVFSFKGHKYGFAMTGEIDGVPKRILSSDYNWTWKNEIGTDHFVDYDIDYQPINMTVDTVIWKASNNNDALNITLIIEDSPLVEGVKINFIVSNNLGRNVQNTKFWFINTVNEGDETSYNDKTYRLSSNKTIHIKDNFNQEDLRFKYKDYAFSFNDLIETGWNITNIYLGNGSIIGRESTVIQGIAVTRGTGTFPNGVTVELDPIISDLAYTETVSGTWTNPTRIEDSCDNIRATDVAANKAFSATNFGSLTGINTNEDITVHGIELTFQANAGNACSFPNFPRVNYNFTLSPDSGTTETTGKTNFYTCNNDVNKVFGGLSDTWGRTWTKEELNRTNFLVNEYTFLPSSGGFGNADCLWRRVNYTIILGDVPVINLISPGNDTLWTDNRSIILDFNVTDAEDNSFETTLYGTRNLTQMNQTILFKNFSANNIEGVNFNYNWSGQTIDPNDNGLKVLLHFDNNSLFGEDESGDSNDIHDFSPSDLNFTFLNDPSADPDNGKFGGSYFVSFSGPDDDIIRLLSPSVLDDIANNSNMSVFSWLSFTSSSNMGPFKRWSSSGDNKFWRFKIQAFDAISNRTLVEITSNGTATGNSYCTMETVTNFDDFSDGTFHHHGFTFSDGNLTIYADGVAYNSTICPFTDIDDSKWSSSSEQTRINGGISPYSGFIDEFAMWDRALSSNEILNLTRLSDGDYYWKVNATEVIDLNSTESDTYIFHINSSEPVAADSCTYTSGNWDVDCSDNCSIESNVNMDTNSNLSITGIGDFFVNGANITGFLNMLIKGESTTEKCIVHTLNGGEVSAS